MAIGAVLSLVALATAVSLAAVVAPSGRRGTTTAATAYPQPAPTISRITIDAPTWPGWAVARGVATAAAGPEGERYGGVLADAFGGLHPLRVAGHLPLETPSGGPYWPGWDIVRGVALSRDGAGGLVLDGWGGVHQFRMGENGTAPSVVPQSPAYWPGWDIARGIALLPDGSGGYVVDGWGGLHAFRSGSTATVAGPKGAPYWTGWDIARGVALTPDGSGGVVLDGWGGLHPFGVGNGTAPSITPGTAPYWPGIDWARGVTLNPDGTGGYIVDPFGGLHPFGVNGYPGPVPSPATVVLLGDSGIFDGTPALQAAFEHVGWRVEPRTFGGLGLTPPGVLDAWVDAVRQTQPALVVIELGGWDISWQREHGADAYTAVVEDAVERLSSTGARLLWLSMLPGGGIAETPTMNAYYAAAAARHPGVVQYLDVAPAFAAPDGSYPRVVNGQLLRKPDGWHLCPAGAEALAHAALGDVGLDVPGWEQGPWRSADRYDPGGTECAMPG